MHSGDQFQQPMPTVEGRVDPPSQDSASAPNRNSRGRELPYTPRHTPARESPRGHPHIPYNNSDTPYLEENREYPQNSQNMQGLATQLGSKFNSATASKRRSHVRRASREAPPDPGTLGMTWGSARYRGPLYTPVSQGTPENGRRFEDIGPQEPSGEVQSPSINSEGWESAAALTMPGEKYGTPDSTPYLGPPATIAHKSPGLSSSSDGPVGQAPLSLSPGLLSRAGELPGQAPSLTLRKFQRG